MANHFLDKAKELLDSNTFAELKKKVCFIFILQRWVTP
jgi:hypothetical protein